MGFQTSKTHNDRDTTAAPHQPRATSDMTAAQAALRKSPLSLSLHPYGTPPGTVPHRVDLPQRAAPTAPLLYLRPPLISSFPVADQPALSA